MSNGLWVGLCVVINKGGVKMNNLIPAERIENRIYMIRGQKVMLDRDLAGLYEVETKQLKRQVKRNFERFPEDFMFQLTGDEYGRLRYQFGTLKRGEHSKYLPYAFTEQGIAMLSSVLCSRKAVLVNIQIMRAFVRIKQSLYAHKELALKLDLLEERFGKRLDRHDKEIGVIFEAIRKMLTIEEKPRRKIGFVQGEVGSGKREAG